MSGKNFNMIIILTLFFSVAFISIGYAALNTNLTISGEATVRGPGRIFVSDIRLLESNDATENFSPTFTDNTTNIGVNVPSGTSSFTYEVTVTNDTTDYYYLSKLFENIHTDIGTYLIMDMYLYTEFEPGKETKFQIKYTGETTPVDPNFVLNLEYDFTPGRIYRDPFLNGADPELIDGLIPIVYNEELEEWEKADVVNQRWYIYDELQWANAASVIPTKRMEYANAEPGTLIPMEDIISMMVWIPRYSYTLKDDLGYQGYGGGSLSYETPGAFDIIFHGIDEQYYGSASYSGDFATEYYTSSAFCWGNTCDSPETRGNAENIEIPGFWVAKFEASKSNNILYSIPNVKPMINYSISQTFYFVQDLMNGMHGYENYGYVGYVDAHLIKNTEWGAVAYLSQSKYGKYGNTNYTGANKEIYLNNCNIYITGIGGSSAADGATSSTCYTNTYDTYNGMGASTTGNIYGVYDMVGGTFDRVMGIVLKPDGSYDAQATGFTSLPEGRYINVYPSGTYSEGDVSPIKGDALTESLYFYTDRYLGDPRFGNYYDNSWFYRGGSLFFPSTAANGVFSYTLFTGQSDSHHSSRFTITIY